MIPSTPRLPNDRRLLLSLPTHLRSKTRVPAMTTSAAAAAPSPPFLTKLYDMVDDPATDAVVAWSRDNNSFIIWNHLAFARDLLPKYFKHNNLSSFVRQLNTYGFHKVDPDRYEFANEGFLRGQKHLLKTITRRKPTQNISQPQLPQGKKTSVKACIEVGKFGLEEDIAMLKRDKNVLMQELVKLRHHHQKTNRELDILRRNIQIMEQNQQGMLSFIAVSVDPVVLAQLVQQNGNSMWKTEANKKRRFPVLEQGFIDGLEPSADAQIVKYQPLVTEMPKPGLMSKVDDDVEPVSGGAHDLCTNLDAMSLVQEPCLTGEGDIPMSNFSIDELEELMASPIPENNGQNDPSFSDILKYLDLPELDIPKDFEMPEQDMPMEISQNISFK